MKKMTLKLHSMYAAANILGYSLPFMNEICKRAFWSGRPFHVLKDENNKYFIEANSLQRYIDSCPDFNPYMIPAATSALKLPSICAICRWAISMTTASDISPA